MDPLPADIAHRMEAVKRQQAVWADALNTYSRALALLSDGTRVCLAGLGMSEGDIVKNIDLRLGQLREQSTAQMKKVEATAQARLRCRRTERTRRRGSEAQRL